MRLPAKSQNQQSDIWVKESSYDSFPRCSHSLRQQRTEKCLPRNTLSKFLIQRIHYHKWLLYATKFSTGYAAIVTGTAIYQKQTKHYIIFNAEVLKAFLLRNKKHHFYSVLQSYSFQWEIKTRKGEIKSSLRHKYI